MFQGTFSLSLDAKGRFAVPTRYRELLAAMADGAITITKHPERCLKVYPIAEWQKIQATVATWDEATRGRIKRMVLSGQECEMDASGRVLVPPPLRQFAGLTDEVMLLGVGTHFELWDSATYLALEEQVSVGDIPAGFSF